MPASVLQRKHLALVAVFAFLAGAIYLTGAVYAGFDDVVAALQRLSFACIGAALTATLAGVILRCVRWRLYLCALGHDLPMRVHLPIYVAGLSLVAVPGKLGELIRSLFLKPQGVPYSKSIAAFLADRLADLTGVLLVAAILAWLVYPQAGAVAIPAVVLAASLAAFRMRYGATSKRLAKLLPRRTESYLCGVMSSFEHLRSCLAPGLFTLGIAIAVIAYSAQALALAYIVKGLADHVPSTAVFLSFFLAMLGGAASMLPAGLGSMEAALVALLHHFGTPLPEAVAATMLIRLCTLWLVIALSLLCLLLVQRQTARASVCVP